jgi:hypothetical protein
MRGEPAGSPLSVSLFLLGWGRNSAIAMCSKALGLAALNGCLYQPYHCGLVLGIGRELGACAQLMLV